jgi:sporulation protein YqfC
MQKNILKTIAKALDAPKDVIFGLPNINILGREQIKIENHMGIKIYEADILVLNTKIGKLTIKGNNLILREIKTDIMLVNGEIESISYNN